MRQQGNPYNLEALARAYDRQAERNRAELARVRYDLETIERVKALFERLDPEDARAVAHFAELYADAVNN